MRKAGRKVILVRIETSPEDIQGMHAAKAIVTARGNQHDFVSRYFAPAIGINEDPVTGSTHCLLSPYWAQQLDKLSLTAYQCSARGGELFCRLEGERVKIGGDATLVASGTLHLN